MTLLPVPSRSTKPYWYVTIYLCIFLLVMYIKAPSLSKIESNIYVIPHSPSGAYTIMSSDLNLYYLLHLPFTVQHMNNMEMPSIVLLAGNESVYYKIPAAAMILNELTRLNVRDYYYYLNFNV